MAKRKNRFPYMYDNTARELQRELEKPLKQVSNTTRKNREKIRHMNIGYILFLSGALLACTFCLVRYIQMQSEITTKIAQISKMEKELNSLKLSNDETYSKINSSINLEEIRQIAIEELGMTYAEEGQVILYQGNKKDYMHQTMREMK